MSPVDLFSDQFQDSADLLALTEALLISTEHLEIALDDLLEKRWIDTAVGVQLDKLGDILGVTRQGRTDAVYRNALRFQIFINTSKATPETIIKATRELSQGDFIRYWENYPAGFQVFTNGPNVIDISGGVIQDFLYTLENGDPLELDDGEGFLMRTAYEAPEGLANFLKTIAPAGINTIAVSFSLGELPLFGFGGDFITATLVLDDDEDFILDDAGILDLSLDEVAPSADGFIGFADFELFGFVLDDDEPLELNIEINIFNAVVAVDDGFGDPELAAFYLDNGNYLEFFTRAPVIYNAAIIVDDGLGPEETLLHLDNDESLQFYSEDGITEETTLLVFDGNQPAIGGGKLVEGMVSI